MSPRTGLRLTRPNAEIEERIDVPAKAGSEDGEKNGPSLRVLLVEDNIVNQRVIIALLSDTRIQVDVAGNGLEAVNKVSTQPFDIVLMDIQMPEMDGIEATRRIREMPGEISQIPIVAVTAHAMAGDQERYLQAGMNDYLSKPLYRDLLLEKIDYWTSCDPRRTLASPAKSELEVQYPVTLCDQAAKAKI